MIEEVIVAVSTSKRGGPCKKCRNYISRHGFIAKVATEGKTTSQGQGPGIWVCEPCSADYEWTDDARVDKKITYRDYRPDIYDELDVDQPAPRGFMVGMRYSEYQKIAYQLGYYQGYHDSIQEQQDG